jgi:phage shock protein A
VGGLWNYIKTLFGEKVEEMKDPEIEIEQAINAAEERDQELRNQAAKVVAHRMQVAEQLEDASASLAESEELARQAVIKADAAQKGGQADDAARWTRTAQALAMKMQAGKNSVAMLKQQMDVAEDNAEKAKQAVQSNAMELEEISAKRMEMLGELEAAKMQESLNKAMASINATVDVGDAPSLKEVEDKIEERMAEARARAELDTVTPEGAMAELEREVDMASAEATLDELKAQLGITDAPALSTPSTPSTPPPGSSTPGS